jgi:hypothetical protein
MARLKAINAGSPVLIPGVDPDKSCLIETVITEIKDGYITQKEIDK